ncbi:hypothetical protein TI39_contig4230g00006 [Zymoseptoria brevis]|uniref:C2H2-type domain-containing protein n=1 Tax=Zymoseptoria brevis TaxID=1047168 RepID=A0A0F4G9C9_9PEZI|nr:hypothetical protein TI39_contig4230g00006 [Zymoseptoria brevis]
MSTLTETLDRLTQALSDLTLPTQNAASLRSLAIAHASNILPPSMLNGPLSIPTAFEEASSLANSFTRRYANELWPGTTIRQDTANWNAVFQVFLNLLQMPIDVPENELLRELAPPGPSTGALPGPSTGLTPTPHAGLPPALWADPPPASPGRRIVSAPEELTTRAQVARPRTLEERVADLAERDRLIEGLCQDPDADPDIGLDDTLGSGDFAFDGHECKLCEEIFEETEELLEHYEKVHPDGAEDDDGGDGSEEDNVKDREEIEAAQERETDVKEAVEKEEEAKDAEEKEGELQPADAEQEEEKSPEKKETRRERMEKERVERRYR